jgi:glycosyltransferase involved in cell wall biosynthesis
MKIAACIIVKDDSEYLDLVRCLDSVSAYVNDVYITVNGKKYDKIKRLESNKVHLSYLAWNEDFSEQRNFNFSQAKGYDYIFWLDSDDVLINGGQLYAIAERAKKENYDTVFLTYWYSCTFNGEPSIETLKEVEMEHMRERLIKPDTQYWKGMLHETPVPYEGKKLKYVQVPYSKEQPIAIMHTADLSQAKDNMKRNKRILEKQLEIEKSEGKVDPRTQLYLLKIYAEDDDESMYDKVFELGELYLLKSGWNEERATCLEHMSIVTSKRGQFHQSIGYLHDAIKEYPLQPLLYIRLAQSYFNVGAYRQARHWLEVASTLDLDNRTGTLKNIKAMKMMFAEVLLKLNYQVDKDIEKSLQSATLLYNEYPIEEYKQQVFHLQDLKDLNDACKNIHSVCKYLKSIGEESRILPLINELPPAINEQKIFIQMRKDLTPPRIWEKDEICYFANFMQPHFEKWDSSSLNKGIGGSETAVIELSRQFAKKGYKVTVYGDPIKKGLQDGVMYLPYYYFNQKDSFNIFIQWRNWQLATSVKAKKFYVDLHDVYSDADIEDAIINHVDKFIVRSDYHKDLATKISKNKFLTISNGI